MGRHRQLNGTSRTRFTQQPSHVERVVAPITVQSKEYSMHRLSVFILTFLVSVLATATPSSAGQAAANIDTIAPAVASYGESVTITGIGLAEKKCRFWGEVFPPLSSAQLEAA